MSMAVLTSILNMFQIPHQNCENVDAFTPDPTALFMGYDKYHRLFLNIPLSYIDNFNDTSINTALVLYQRYQSNPNSFKIYENIQFITNRRFFGIDYDNFTHLKDILDGKTKRFYENVDHYLYKLKEHNSREWCKVKSITIIPTTVFHENTPSLLSEEMDRFSFEDLTDIRINNVVHFD